MGKSTETTQKNEPPSWARPLLTKAAREGERLYDEGIGYNTYMGPTQAPLSEQTLGGMNALMAATGAGGGSPITNESINALIPQMPTPEPAPQPQQRANPMGLVQVPTEAGRFLSKLSGGREITGPYGQFTKQWAVETPDGQTIPLPNQQPRKGSGRGGLW